MLLTLPLIAVFILLLFGIAVLVIRLVAPRFPYSWLIAASGALIVWPILLFARTLIPDSFPLKFWDLPGLITTPPAILLDEFSWPFAFSIAALLLATILTDAARTEDADWSTWSLSLFGSAIGLIAVMAGNPITLLLAWAGLDMAGVVVMIWQTRSGGGARPGAMNFIIRTIGIMILLWVVISSQREQQQVTFANIPPQFGIYLLLAAWLHMGTLPIQPVGEKAGASKRSDATLFQLVFAASSLVLISRTASIGIASSQLLYIYLLAAVIAIYGCISWLFSREENEGQPFWILGLSAFSIVSAARGMPGASLAWGVVALLSGGLLLLFTLRIRVLLIFPLIGLLSLTGLPLTLSWNGNGLYGLPFSPFLLIFILSQALFLFGYLRFSIQVRSSQVAGERLIWIIYTWGLILLTLSVLIVSWWENLPLGKLVTPVSLTSLLPVVMVIGIAALTFFLDRRGWQVTARGRSIFVSIFNFHWIYEAFSTLFQGLERILGFISLVLEGEGGILWALLWLVLLLTFLTQTVLGGI